MKYLLLLFFLPLFAGVGVTHTYLEDQWVHIIEVDPVRCELLPAKAIDNGIGRESVLSMARRKGAEAAVNGGFFSIGGTLDGLARGALKIDEWIALPLRPRGCIGWSAGVPPIFDRLLVFVDSSHGPIDGLNRARGNGEVILFTPLFNRTTLTTPDGEEVAIRDGVVTAVKRGGSSPIPADGYILSIQMDHSLYGTLNVGDPFDFDYQIVSPTGLTTAAQWKSCDYIVGGTPLLIRDGQEIRDFSPERTRETFLTEPHSRTAVGYTAEGHWIFVVAAGLTMDELVDLMASLGCTDALNLDGGGSSTMVLEGAIINDPHGDEDEGDGEKVVRRVSDAILIR